MSSIKYWEKKLLKKKNTMYRVYHKKNIDLPYGSRLTVQGVSSNNNFNYLFSLEITKWTFFLIFPKFSYFNILKI